MRCATDGSTGCPIAPRRSDRSQNDRPRFPQFLDVAGYRFLDYLDETGERLTVLFILTAFCGLRRDEVTGLAWAEIDLGQGVGYIRETGSGDGPKSEAGVRVIPLPLRSPAR